MKIRIILVCYTMLFVFALRAERGNMDLYLLIGQSNMAGRGVLTASNRISTDGVYKLTKNGEWEQAVEPIHFDKKAAGAGLAASFARTMADRPGAAEIGLIPCAVGGSGMDKWIPGGELYTNAVARTRIALADGTLKGILWHQGEHDATTAALASAWKDKFASMVDAFREEFGDVPFVAGELGHYLGGYGAGDLQWRTINRSLHELEGVLPLYSVVRADGLTPNDDILHFDTASLRELGRRFAAHAVVLEAETAVNAAE